MLCRCAIAVSDAGDHADIFAALVCAEFVSVNWR
jgi:hypothetical protein